MTADTARILKRLALAVAAGGLLYFCLAMLTPACGHLIGYANDQPPLRVVRLSDATTDAEVQRILRLMDSLFRAKPVLHEDTWPGPSRPSASACAPSRKVSGRGSEPL